jgi:phosphatidylglycerol lysyltransferase
MFAHQHWLDRNQEWWRFALSADAPRFLRASVGVVGALLAVGLMRLIAASSDASANLALLGDKAFLFSANGRGLLMYRVEGRAWVALGDPIGEPTEQAELAWSFRALADRRGGWAVFYEVGAGCLPLYIDLGLTLLKLGERAQVSLRDFSLEGPRRRVLRRTQRQMEREGVSFEVIPRDRVPPIVPQLRLVSDAWLRQKRTREKGFSLGRFDPDYIARFPIAVARQQGAIVAFANIWTSLSKVELSIDLMRHTAEAPGGVMHRPARRVCRAASPFISADQGPAQARMRSHDPQCKDHVTNGVGNQEGTPGHFIDPSTCLAFSREHQEAELDDDDEQEETGYQGWEPIGQTRQCQGHDAG